MKSIASRSTLPHISPKIAAFVTGILHYASPHHAIKRPYSEDWRCELSHDARADIRSGFRAALLGYHRCLGAHSDGCPPDTTCIHGHFVAHTLAERYPDALLITWVRDPVERVASSYYHRLRSPDWRHPVSIELHAKKLTLVQYAGLELVRNETTRFFGEMRPENFAFIGLVEDFDASIDRFFAQFKLPRLPVPRENTNPERRTRFYELRDDERRQILDLNQNDWDLYQACVKANRSKQCLAEQGVYTA